MHKTLKHSYLRHFILSGFGVFLAFFGRTLPTSAATDKPAHLASFDPAKGFKPAQSDLTQVFLQIAGSLECYGSPEPYLRHMQAEHERIEAKFKQQNGGTGNSFCPVNINHAYLDRFAANWKHIAPQLGLESLTRSTGHLMQMAINGPEGKGTILVDVFKRHQHEVDAAMRSKTAVSIPDFTSLQAEMVKCLKFNETPLPLENLTAEQQAAIDPANDARSAFLKLFAALEKGLAPADAEKVKAVILGIITDIGRMAQSEIEAAILDDSLDYTRSLQGPYSPEQETALNAEEQKTYIRFFKKPRFTRADFPALEKFYSGAYDRLTERGKDEMSKRVDAGTRPAK